MERNRFTKEDFITIGSALSNLYDGVKAAARKVKQWLSPQSDTPELAAFKQHSFYKEHKPLFQKYAGKIDLVKLAQDQGYELDKSVSNKRVSVLHKEGETLLVTRDEKGRFQYTNANNRKDSGNTLAFIAKQGLNAADTLTTLRRYLEFAVDKKSLAKIPKIDNKDLIRDYAQKLESDYKGYLNLPGYKNMKPEEKVNLLSDLKRAEGKTDQLMKTTLEKADFIGYAKRRGFEVVEDLSTRESVIMRSALNPKDVIAVSRDEKGRFVYQGANNERGTIVDFDRSRNGNDKNSLESQLKQYSIENAVAQHSYKKPLDLINWQDSKREALIAKLHPVSHNIELEKTSLKPDTLKQNFENAFAVLMTRSGKAQENGKSHDLAVNPLKSQEKSNSKVLEQNKGLSLGL